MISINTCQLESLILYLFLNDHVLMEKIVGLLGILSCCMVRFRLQSKTAICALYCFATNIGLLSLDKAYIFYLVLEQKYIYQIHENVVIPV